MADDAWGRSCRGLGGCFDQFSLWEPIKCLMDVLYGVFIASVLPLLMAESLVGPRRLECGHRLVFEEL